MQTRITPAPTDHLDSTSDALSVQLGALPAFTQSGEIACCTAIHCNSLADSGVLVDPCHILPEKVNKILLQIVPTPQQTIVRERSRRSVQRFCVISD